MFYELQLITKISKFSAPLKFYCPLEIVGAPPSLPKQQNLNPPLMQTSVQVILLTYGQVIESWVEFM